MDSDHDFRRGIIRPLATTVALLAAPLFVPFALTWLWAGPSTTGWIYWLGFVACFVGLGSAPWRRKRFRGIVRFGVALVCIAVILRLGVGESGNTMGFERVGEPAMVAEYANRLVPEADSAVVGGWLIWLGTGFIEEPDHSFLDAMREGYRLMADEEGIVPSPWAATYLGMQSPESFDMQSFPADGDSALIFLHGYGGNFTLPCWEVAQAAATARVATFCPSTGWEGQWWLPEGKATLQKTMEVVRERGYPRIFVAGLSNGGIGLSRIAGELRRDVAGFVFVSGVSQHAKPMRRPYLVIHGDRDTMTATTIAKGYAKASIHGQYVELDGGHFVLVQPRAEARRAIGEWLEKQTRRPVAP